MKTHHYVTVILSFVVALLILPTTALAADNVKFKGHTADAYFDSIEGCIQTTVIVFAGEDVAKQGGYQSATNLIISQYDVCTGGTPLFEAYGSASLDDAAFQADKQLNSATLNTTLELFDYVSNVPVTVNVNLSWTGIGEVSRGKSNSHFDMPGCKFHSTFNGTFRSAQASGTVSYNGTNLTLANPLSAFLQSVKSGSLTIGCEG